MRRDGIINSRLAGSFARLWHTDHVVVCDAGLPRPAEDFSIRGRICRLVETPRRGVSMDRVA
jgi:D-ribose pyranose/furanose isomerase RbsD